MRYCFIIPGLILLAASCNSSDKKTGPQPSVISISNPIRKAASVYLATDEKDNPVISWCETDDAGKKFFFLSFFDTAASKFSSAINIPIEQDASIHEEGMPKVAVKGDGSILAVYETSSPTKENEWAGYVRYIQSFDKGRSWTLPRCVHADTTAGKSRSFAAVTRLSDGEIGACWLDAAFDHRMEGRPVRFASTSEKAGFVNELLVDSVACECCRTAISSDDHGNISIVYRDILNTSIRDISVSSSVNNGRSFSNPVSFSGDNWNINGCPHNGPSVVNSAKATYATWFTGGSEKGVWYSELDNKNRIRLKKQISANGRNIQLCLLPSGGRVIAYSETIRNGDSLYSKIVVNKIEDGNTSAMDITPLTAHAAFPVIKSFGANKIIVAWFEQNKIFYTTLNDASKFRPGFSTAL